MKRRSLMRTGIGFSLFVFLTIAILFIIFLVGLFSYNKNSDSTFGLSGSMSALVISGYGPVAAASMFGFRNVLFSGVLEPSPYNAVISGVWILYIVCGLGIAAAATGLLYVCFNPPVEKAQIAIPLSAAIWAATVGEVLKRFFREQQVA